MILFVQQYSVPLVEGGVFYNPTQFKFACKFAIAAIIITKCIYSFVAIVDGKPIIPSRIFAGVDARIYTCIKAYAFVPLQPDVDDASRASASYITPGLWMISIASICAAGIDLR